MLPMTIPSGSHNVLSVYGSIFAKPANKGSNLDFPNVVLIGLMNGIEPSDP